MRPIDEPDDPDDTPTVVGRFDSLFRGDRHGSAESSDDCDTVVGLRRAAEEKLGGSIAEPHGEDKP